MSVYAHTKVIIREVVTMPFCMLREIYRVGKRIHPGVVCGEVICVCTGVSRCLIGLSFLGQTLFFEL